MNKIPLPSRPTMSRIALWALAVFAFGLVASPMAARAGGLYNVAECSPGHTGTGDASVEGGTTAYSASSSCSSGNWLQVQSAGVAAAGASKQWVYKAPAGTRIERFKADYNLVGDSNPDGNRSYFFIKRDGQANQENLSVVGLGSTAGTYDSTIQGLGPFSSMGVGLFCSKPVGNCAQASDQFSRLSGISFRIEDVSPPSPPVVVGDAVDGKWVSGTTQIGVGDVDVGGGVYRTTVAVNGTQAVSDVVCSPGQDGNGYVSSMTPCDPVVLHFVSVNTSTAPFSEGQGNAISICSHEFGFAGASTCTSSSFKVDNVAPASPQAADVVGGQGWRRDNDFDLRWNNPNQTNAPIAGAVVRITGPGGFDQSTTYMGNDIEAIDGLTVPDVGSYTAQIHLVDAAGNASASASASAGVALKFDDTVPVKSKPEKANGWISRTELDGGYVQTWQKPFPAETPPSGIAGYRVISNSNADTDPCGGSSDPRACSGVLTENGINSNSRMLRPADLSEGSNYVHVVPISGSGMRATIVGHSELKVDLSDPVTNLVGVPGGWVNRPVEVEVEAVDPISGMNDTDEFPGDDPPRTALVVDGSLTEDPDANIAATVTGEGVHELEYWARDLAGNENDGIGANLAPGTATLKIDTTAPALAFPNHQDPSDPDELTVAASDELSGVASGTISYRQAGGESWKSLGTALEGGRLVARVDSNDLTLGATYLFRAQATDRAGNESTTTKRSDGSEMTVTGPFRSLTSFESLVIDGKRRARVGYGKKVVVSGRLVASGQSPVPGAKVDLVQTFDPGSKSRSIATTVATDPSGRFKGVLPGGPSRSITAGYGGDLRYLGSRSAPAKLRVVGKVSLRATPRVRAGAKATFSGRVGGMGARFSKVGKAVEVQVRIGSRWKTVGRSLRTDRTGRYKLRYRFVASYARPTLYRFRTVVLRERGWPYLPTESKQRRVVVVP